jgi:membrane protease YdiL (CAAX protease family)
MQIKQLHKRYPLLVGILLLFLYTWIIDLSNSGVLPFQLPLILIVPWFLFEMFTNGEEIGWRGYILPRLQVRYTALVSSLIVGVIWSVWHLPKFIGTGSSGGRSFAWFTVFCMASAILFTWIYNNSRGSLLLVPLFHATNNTAGMFLPVSFSAAGGILPNLMIVLYALAAVVVTVAAGPARLSRKHSKQVQEQVHEQVSKPVYQV